MTSRSVLATAVFDGVGSSSRSAFSASAAAAVTVAAQVRRSLTVKSAPVSALNASLTSALVTSCQPVLSRYWRRRSPGALLRLRARIATASGGSVTSACRSTPDLAGKRKCRSGPRTVTWSRCRVVTPWVPCSCSYSSPPVRNSPRSSIRRATAMTRSRVRPDRRRSRLTALRNSGSRGTSCWTRSCLALLRSCVHAAWYRYWRRPASSVPTAWMWPLGYGLIHTSVQAGGMTRAWIRSRSVSPTGPPSSSR